ncbi:MAG: diaminopimelate decarboxylase [Bacteroidales bacterium]|nr:diaminopimelate decarboxylase [Bacteroidales bacterium]
MRGSFPVEQFKTWSTPFYYYDLELLEHTLSRALMSVSDVSFLIHYALKANAHAQILSRVSRANLGADCVSGNEILAALAAGIAPARILFAGVGKADWEIELALQHDIACFNVESIPEIQVIGEIAARAGKTARIALRVNPNVNAHTHHYITTGLTENKFGIPLSALSAAIDTSLHYPHLSLEGIHAHIGSQIVEFSPFKDLCRVLNDLQDSMAACGIYLKHINVGGGLGINYEHPNHHPVADFEAYFRIFREHLHLREGQKLHFELGRSLVAACGTLITKVLYVKEGEQKTFAIVDAAMTDLLRPALYQAYHRIENITSVSTEARVYDVVGPVCESSDLFARDFPLATTCRGDLLALRSTGAYGEAMASGYNLRALPTSHTSEEIFHHK